MLQNNDLLAGTKSFLKNFLSDVPRNDRLYLSEWRKDGRIYIAVVCECGNRKMTVHPAGVRCHICGLLHDHFHWEKMRKQALWRGETLAKSSLQILKDQNEKPKKNKRLLLWIPKLGRIVTKKDLKQMKFKKRLA
jgi:hypothetical protein